MAELTHIIKKINPEGGSVVVVNDEDVKRIQKKLLEILDDIVQCCKKNGINWQLSGGSVLGAVRHKGFIPWDDDLDINMTRRDFDRFVTVFEKELNSKYWLHAPGLTKGYDRLTPRVMSKDIRARDIFSCDMQECGLWVDIFVMENAPDRFLLRKIHGWGCMGVRYLLSCVRFARHEEELKLLLGSNKEFESIAGHRRRIGKVLNVLPVSFWMRISLWWIRICKDSNTKKVVIVSGSKQYFDETYERTKMCDSIDACFEDRVVKITKDYDTYMRKLYGDYMVLPPKENRETHVFMELDREKLYQ